MSETPLISIIMPTYNSERYLRESIGSVLRQIFRDWELIVVDDGSTDNTNLILERYHDPRITVLRQSHGGVSSARNLALSNARGKYIAFLDSDDSWSGKKLQRQFEVMEAEGVDVLTTAIREVDDMNRYLSVPIFYEIHRNPISDLLTKRVIIPSATMVRASELKRLGSFNEALKTAEDWELWIRLSLMDCCFASLPEVLTYYRIHARSLSRTGVQLSDYLELFSLWKDYRDNDLISSEVLAKGLARCCHYLTVVEKPNEAFQLVKSAVGISARVLLEGKLWYALAVILSQLLTPKKIHRTVRRWITEIRGYSVLQKTEVS